MGAERVPGDEEVLGEYYQDDVEGADQDYDSPELRSLEFWESKQRELVTSVVDYNLSTLAQLVSARTIDVSPKYQRRFRWDDRRQSKLIESFLMNVPVPPIYLNEDSYGHYSVIDGKQRLLAITEFLRGSLRLTGLEVFGDVNGLTYFDIPPTLQAVLATRPTLRAIIVLRQSDDDVKFEVFQRLNTGGVRLNPQEIRNSTYPGPLNDLILELSVNPAFHRLLGVMDARRSAIYQEMRDAEFVLRFLTFQNSWETFSGGMKQSMDRFMSKNQKASRRVLSGFEKSFLSAMENVDACFDGHAFRRWVPESGQWRRQVLAALYDAEMFGCQHLHGSEVREKREVILDSFKMLFTDPDFRQAIDAATNTPTYFRTRIRMVKDVLSDILEA